MSDLAWLVGVAVLGLFGLTVIALAMWRGFSAPPSFEPEPFALARGWQFVSDAPNNWSISNPAWQLAYRTDSGPTPVLRGEARTVWSSDGFPHAGSIFLGPRPSSRVPDPMILAWLQAFVRLNPGEQAQLAARSQPTPTGDPAFDARFFVTTTNMEYAHARLDTSAREAILTFAREVGRDPQIVWSPEVFRISIRGEIAKEADAEALIALGQRLNGR